MSGPAAAPVPPKPADDEREDREEREDDAFVDDLPPLDDEASDDNDNDNDGDASSDADRDELDKLDDLGDETDSLDDQVAAELEVGDELDADPDAGGAVGDDDAGLGDDGGDDEPLDDEASALGDDADGFGESDDHDVDEAGAEGDDGGAEGIAGDDVVLTDADLPALDADESDDAADLDELAFAEPIGARDAAWPTARVPGGDKPAHAVVALEGVVASAGARALVIAPGAVEARDVALATRPRHVALVDGVAYFATAKGAITLAGSADGEARVLSAALLGDNLEAFAATPGRFWGASSGALYRVAHVGGPAVRVRDAGVRTIAASRAALWALVTDGAAASLERRRADDESPAVTQLAPELASLARAATLVVAPDGERLALLANGEAHVSRDGGGTFARLAGAPGAVVALAFVEGDALALVAARGGSAKLVLFEGSREPRVVATLADAGLVPGADAVAGLAWDASREAAWIATPAGLVTVTRPSEH